MTDRERNAYLAAFGAIWLLSVIAGADAVGLIDVNVWAWACTVF